MSSIDSIYNKIISDIEKDLPISIKRPGARYRAAAGTVNNNNKTKFEDVLNTAVNTNSIGTPNSAAVNTNSIGTVNPTSVKEINAHDKDTRIEAAIITASKKYNIDYALIKGVIKAESDFNPTCVSNAGAMGLMQLMPSNCEEYGVTDPFNIEQNIDAGTRHLRDMIDRYNGDLSLGLAAYNAGPGNVNKYGGIPPFKETQTYVPRVLANMEGYKTG